MYTTLKWLLARFSFILRLNIQEVSSKNNILFFFSLIKPSEVKTKAIEKIDGLLELYMGIQDTDLGKIILFLKVLYFLI